MNQGLLRIKMTVAVLPNKWLIMGMALCHGLTAMANKRMGWEKTLGVGLVSQTCISWASSHMGHDPVARPGNKPQQELQEEGREHSAGTNYQTTEHLSFSSYYCSSSSSSFYLSVPGSSSFSAPTSLPLRSCTLIYTESRYRLANPVGLLTLSFPWLTGNCSMWDVSH